MAWLDLSESVEELFAEFQDDRDYEQFIVLSDIATCRGVASAERSKEWREERRRDAGWVARERQRQRARRIKIVKDAFALQLVTLKPKRKRGPKRPGKIIVSELQLSFAWGSAI